MGTSASSRSQDVVRCTLVSVIISLTDLFSFYVICSFTTCTCVRLLVHIEAFVIHAYIDMWLILEHDDDDSSSLLFHPPP